MIEVRRAQYHEDAHVLAYRDPQLASAAVRAFDSPLRSVDHNEMRARRQLSIKWTEHRLRSTLAARPITEVAEVCAQPSAGLRAPPAAISEEMRRLADALCRGLFDTDRRPVVIWIPADGRSIVRLTGKQAAGIRATVGEQGLMDILHECWMGGVAWRAWFKHINRAPPEVWATPPDRDNAGAKSGSSNGRQPKSAAKLDLVKEHLRGASVWPGNGELALKLGVSTQTVSRAKREMRAK